MNVLHWLTLLGCLFLGAHGLGETGTNGSEARAAVSEDGQLHARGRRTEISGESGHVLSPLPALQCLAGRAFGTVQTLMLVRLLSLEGLTSIERQPLINYIGQRPLGILFLALHILWENPLQLFK